jgi:hypothetical protein
MSPPVVTVLFVLVSGLHNTHKTAFDKFFYWIAKGKAIKVTKMQFMDFFTEILKD